MIDWYWWIDGLIDINIDIVDIDGNNVSRKMTPRMRIGEENDNSSLTSNAKINNVGWIYWNIGISYFEKNAPEMRTLLLKSVNDNNKGAWCGKMEHQIKNTGFYYY